MDNATVPPENVGSLNSPGFMVFSILLALITLVAGLMMEFTIIPLLKATSVPETLCLFLVNLLLAGLLLALVLFLAVCAAVGLINVSAHSPRPLYLCRVYLLAFGTSTVTRLWSSAASSFAILAAVRFGKKTISAWLAAVIIIALWLVPIVVCLFVLLPYVFEAQFLHGVACILDINRAIIPPGHYTFIASWTIFGGLTPLIISIIVPIVCFYYY